MRESRIPLWESGFHAFLASRLLNAGPVMAYQEVTPEISVQPVARIRI